MKTKCPHCAATYSLTDESMVGKVVRCKKCEDTFRVRSVPPEKPANPIAQFEEYLDGIDDLLKNRSAGQDVSVTEAPDLGGPPPTTAPRIEIRQPDHGRRFLASSHHRRDPSRDVWGFRSLANSTRDIGRFRITLIALSATGFILLIGLLTYVLWPSHEKHGATSEPLARREDQISQQRMPRHRIEQRSTVSEDALKVADDPLQRATQSDEQLAEDEASTIFGTQHLESTSSSEAPTSGRTHQLLRDTERSPRTPAQPENRRSDVRDYTNSHPASGSLVHEPFVAQAKNSVAIIEHQRGWGTGFVVAEDVLATNAHVVQGSFVDELTVHFPSIDDQPRKVTRIVYEDVPRDLCLLEVNTSQSQALPVAHDYQFEPSELVLVIGNPGTAQGIALVHAVNEGRLSAQVRIDNHSFYQINASVNPGSSGGPVLNRNGEVIAVVALKVADQIVPEIQQALGRLDDQFRANRGAQMQEGIAYGIPAQALEDATSTIKTSPEVAGGKANAQHLARTLFARFTALGGIHFLSAQINASPELYQQAQRRRTTIMRVESELPRMSPRARRNATQQLETAREEFVEVMPPHLAQQLHRNLGSEESVRLIQFLAKDARPYLDQVKASDHVDAVVNRNLHQLSRTVAKLGAFAENPGRDYSDYCTKILEFEHDLKDAIERLAGQLE